MVKNGFGRIININSIDAFSVNCVDGMSYACSKAALMQATKNFAVSLATTGVTVNGIAPVWIWTPMMAQRPGDYMKQAAATIPMAGCPTRRTTWGCCSSSPAPPAAMSRADFPGGRRLERQPRVLLSERLTKGAEPIVWIPADGPSPPSRALPGSAGSGTTGSRTMTAARSPCGPDLPGGVRQASGGDRRPALCPGLLPLPDGEENPSQPL